MFFTCAHSHRRCFEVSVMPHLGHSSVTVILYFFMLTCVNKSLGISLKYILLSFGFLQLLLNFVMFSPTKFSIPSLFLTLRASILFSAFLSVICNSLTVMEFTFFLVLGAISIYFKSSLSELMSSV